MLFRKNTQNNKIKDEATQWLIFLQSPQLTAEKEAAFFKWLEASPKHQAAYVLSEQMWERGEVLNRIPVPHTIHPAPIFTWLKFAWFNHSRWSYAALACLICLTLSLSYKTFTTNHSFKVKNYHTRLGEQHELQLSDNSRVILNTNSAIKVDYSGKNRTVYLKQGEAFFNVTPDSSRPFEVITPQGSVQVLGTQFTVHAFAKKSLVTVLEGAVALDTKRDDATKFTTDLTLVANQQFLIDGKDKKRQAKTVDATSIMSWRNKQLIYKGDSLASVIDDINRYFPQQIHLGDPTLANKEVVAVIQLDKFESVLATLEQSLLLTSEPRQKTHSTTLKSNKTSYDLFQIKK